MECEVLDWDNPGIHEFLGNVMIRVPEIIVRSAEVRGTHDYPCGIQYGTTVDIFLSLYPLHLH